jgi:signal transduction histidine kinase
MIGKSSKLLGNVPTPRDQSNKLSSIKIYILCSALTYIEYIYMHIDEIGSNWAIMTKKRDKKFIPSTKSNPVVHSKKLEKLQAEIQRLRQDIDSHRKTIDAIGRSHDNYISYLGNFARHDIKNAIQSMDSILSTTEPFEFDESKIISLVSYLEVIRHTMDNFSKLIPYSKNKKFTIDTLAGGCELLCRTDMILNEIDIKFEFPKNSIQQIELPFHSILQMMNNLLINSVKSLENSENKKIHVTAEANEEKVRLEFKDTGKEIPLENKDKIFEYGFSTSGGSGIGLFHARYLCTLLEGEISISLTPEERYKKTFSITLPISSKHA